LNTQVCLNNTSNFWSYIQ